MPRDRKPSTSDDDSPYEDSEAFEKCPVCHQEFADGLCPIRSADCPFIEDEQVEDEEDDESDFDDVGKVGDVLKEDKEADRATEEADEESFDEESR